MLNYNPMLLCDFYKLSHREQYPDKTEMVYSTWTPRMSRIKGIDKVVAFGFQYFIKEYFIDYFNTHFFGRPKEEILAEYVRVVKHTLGVEEPYTKHIEDLHDLGYLPLRVLAVKEGTRVPLRVPMMAMHNTKNDVGDFFWLTNYFETLMSSEIWQPMTNATIAYEYRQILDRYAMETVGNTDAVQFQAHDFSERGMVGLVGGANSGAGHLVPFRGSDTIVSILFHEKYYGANIETELVGTSIPATEHSVMCANTSSDDRDEYNAFKRLITETYPNGFVSIVSDTYDFWKVVGETIPQLKQDILNRDGRVVIRPDSGDPVLILTGDPNADNELAKKGLIEALWDIFGGTITEKGYKLLDSHIGAIYGDSITLERADEICKRLKDKGFASINTVLGIGSYSYQYNTRDTFGFAMKATYSIVDGEERLLFKDPKTDDGTKRSQRGLVFVGKNEDNEIYMIDGLDMETYAVDELQYFDLLEEVFVDGKLVREQTLSEIRGLLGT